MCLLMKNNIFIDICWLIETKVRLTGELPFKFVGYMPSYGKGNYARKRRVELLPISCHECSKMQC